MNPHSRQREPHRQRRPAREERLSDPEAEPIMKSSVELKRELLDRSNRSRFIGGTIVQYDPAGTGEALRDTIKWVHVEGAGVIITTYRGRELDLRILSADTELKEEQGVLRVDSWPVERFAIAPRGVEIPTLS